MADNYTTAGSAQTVRVLSQTQVIDVEAVAIYTTKAAARHNKRDDERIVRVLITEIE